MQKRFFIFNLTLLTAILTAFNLMPSSADTLFLKDGRKIEGFIIEEQNDAYLVKVTIGTITLNKKDIREIKKLSSEENYLNLGNQFTLAQNYEEALKHYKKALEINPAFEQAKEAIGKIERLKSEAEEKRLAQAREKEKEFLEKKEKIGRGFGMELGLTGEELGVVKVVRDSQADVAGIKPSDAIVKIDGQNTKGKALEDIINYLLRPDATTFKFTIQRNVELIRKRIEYQKRAIIGIGIFLNADNEGLIISDVISGEPADVAGIRTKDRIVAIDDNPAYGMSLDQTSVLIGGDEATKVKFTIQRTVELERR